MATETQIKKNIETYWDTVHNVARPTGLNTKVARMWWATHVMSGQPKTTKGNKVTPLIDGEAYMASLYEELKKAKLYFFLTGWLINSSFHLRRGGSKDNPKLDNKYSFLELVREVTKKGIQVRIILWERLHSLKTAALNWGGPYHQKAVLEKAGGGWCKVILYNETRHISSFHQKTVVIDGCVGFCGGNDLAIDGGDHWDTTEHHANDKRRSRKESRNWHDIQVKVEGPAVESIQENFLRRWKLEAGTGVGFPPVRHWSAGSRQNPGNSRVQVIRTIPEQPFAKGKDHPELSTVETYARAIINAVQYIYIENQYFSCEYLVALLIKRLATNRGLRLIILLPKDIESLKGFRGKVLDGLKPIIAEDMLRRTDLNRVFFAYPKNLNNHDIYVHAKVMIVDDIFATVGSANFTDRSMFVRDEELGIAWMDRPGGTVAEFRKRLWAEHLGLKPDDPKLNARTGAELMRLWQAKNSKRMDPRIGKVPSDMKNYPLGEVILNKNEQWDIKQSHVDVGCVSAECLTGKIKIDLSAKVWNWQDYKWLSGATISAGQVWQGYFPAQATADQTNKTTVTNLADKSTYKIAMSSYDQ